MPAPVDFAATLGTAGVPSFDAVALMLDVRITWSPPIPPPRALLGDPVAESRWWWAQAMAVEQVAIRNHELIDLWLEAVKRAIDLSQRAVATCPPNHTDRVAMACFAADLVLDACTWAPWAIGPDLPAIVEAVDAYCALLPPELAAARRVRALPLGLAAGRSIADALVVLDGSIEALEGSTWIGPLAEATRSMARVFASLGDATRAIELLDRVRAGLVAAPGTPTDAPDLEYQRKATLIDRAMSLLDLGRIDEAHRALDEVIQGGHPELRTLAQCNRAIARLESGDAAGAEHDLDAAEAAAGGPGPLGWPLVAYLRARIAVALGRDDARKSLDFATNLTKGTGLEWRTWAAFAGHEAAGDPPEALRAYRRMAAVVADARRLSLGYRLDNTALLDKRPHLSAAIHLAAQLGDWRVALEIIETFKARELRVILADRKSGVGSPTSRLEVVERRIDALEFGPPTAMDFAFSEQELLVLRAERVLLLEQEEWQRSAATGLSPASDPPVDDIVGSYADGQAAIDLSFDRPSRMIAAVGLRAGTVVVSSLEITPEVLGAIERRAGNLRSSSPDTLLFDPSTRPAIALEDVVPGPVLDLVDGASDVVISPHGLLHLLSWPAMKRRGVRLFESAAVSVTPSLWARSLLPPNSAVPAGVVAFGAPTGAVANRLERLESAENELRSTLALFEGHRLPTRSAIGPDATKQAFAGAMTAATAPGTVLHIACHATTGTDGTVQGRPFLDGPDDPLSAALVVADGVVSADDLRRQRLLFAEVVLSACSTGWRPAAVADVDLLADTALGLVASVLQAGASMVIASISPAFDEAAADLIQRFHANRLAGELPPLAICHAQRELLSSGTHDPAAFVGFAAFGR